MEKQRTRLLKAKKLGVLLRNAREAVGKSLKEVAAALGIPSRQLGAYERGKKAPSLPEIEAMAYLFGVVPEHFFGDELLTEMPIPPAKTLPLPRLISLRNRIVAATIRNEREAANLPLSRLARQAGISVAKLRDYESAERPIPLPELEAIADVLGLYLVDLLDQEGPLGEWRIKLHQIRAFLDLPADLRAFVAKPVNRPYLELAERLSEMSAERLRAVAESLLEITL